MKRKIAFIINPISGTSQKKQIIEYLHFVFDNDDNYEVKYYMTKCVGDPHVAAKRFKEENYDTVVAVGGDGTVNQVAEALVGGNTSMGIIPVGSGNGLARHMKIPLNYKNAIEVIRANNVQNIDAGKINEQYFFCTAGLGFEAVIGERFNSANKRGLVTYVEICTKVYMNYRRENYVITLDGKKISTKAFLITFANCSQWGNNVYIAPNASANDGMLDVVVWKRAPLIFMPILSARLLFKTIQFSKYIDTYRCSTITIEREKEGLIQFDGESGSAGKTITAMEQHNALKIILPQISINE